MKILRLLFPIVILFLFLPYGSTAETKPPERPHWSLELKGGVFYPAIDNWQTSYGDTKTGQFGASFAYKLLRQLEVGVEAAYIRDRGQGLAPLHTAASGTPVLSGNVTYELLPVSAFVLLRGVFSESQILVPYIGGGWIRMYYREKIENQATVRGNADGFYGRAGLQFLLDGLDQEAANSLNREFGAHHTYLFFEVQQSRVNVDSVTGESVDIGGTSYLAGLLFEF